MNHDDLCTWIVYGSSPLGCSQCETIRRARKAERDRIVAGIESLPYDLKHGDKELRGVVTFTRAEAYNKCIRIAEGND